MPFKHGSNSKLVTVVVEKDDFSSFNPKMSILI